MFLSFGEDFPVGSNDQASGAIFSVTLIAFLGFLCSRLREACVLEQCGYYTVWVSCVDDILLLCSGCLQFVQPVLQFFVGLVRRVSSRWAHPLCW